MANTQEEILQNILDAITTQIDKRQGSYTYDMIAPLATEITKLYFDLNDNISLGFIKTNFDEYLDMRVNEFGVYRKEGVKATGTVTFEVSGTTTIKEGEIIRTDSLQYVTTEEVTGDFSLNVQVESIENGTIYNIDADNEFVLVNANLYVDTITNQDAFTGGIDRETDEELRDRFNTIISINSTSGNVANYIQWALEVDGVGNARVVPLWNGNGTVKVIITDSNNEPVDSVIVDNTYDYIETVRPIGADVTVITPDERDIVFSGIVYMEEGYTLAYLEEAYELKMKEYFKDIEDTLIYNKALALLMTIDGVVNVSNFRMNNLTTDITITEDEVFNVKNIIFSLG